MCIRDRASALPAACALKPAAPKSTSSARITANIAAKPAFAPRDSPAGSTSASANSVSPVSYTHLDVYKRQQRNKVLASLERRGMIERFPAKDDRRKAYIRLKEENLGQFEACLLYTSRCV